jgi:hypothetical protein
MYLSKNKLRNTKKSKSTLHLLEAQKKRKENRKAPWAHK